MDALDAFAREAVGGEGEAELGCPLCPPLVVEEYAVRRDVDRDARVGEFLVRLPLCEELERVEREAQGLVQGQDDAVYDSHCDVLGEVCDVIYDAADSARRIARPPLGPGAVIRWCLEAARARSVARAPPRALR